ncbi:hypothetical protein ACLESO_19060 [Pyxidicoccus sp. 3LG]
MEKLFVTGVMLTLAVGTAQATPICGLGPEGAKQEGAFQHCGELLETCDSCWTDEDRSALNLVLNGTAAENTVFGEVSAVLKTLELDIHQQVATPIPSSLMQRYNDAITVDAVCRSFAIDPELITLDIEDALGDRFVDNCRLAWRISRHQFATVLAQHVPRNVQFSAAGSPAPAANWVLRVTQKGTGDVDNLGMAWAYGGAAREVAIQGWYNIDSRKIAREMIYVNFTNEAVIRAYLDASCGSDPYKACDVADGPYNGYAAQSPSPASIMKKHIEAMFDGPEVAHLNATRKAEARAAALMLWDQFIDSAQAHGYKSVVSRMARKLRTPMMCGVKKITRLSSANASKAAVNGEIHREALLGAKAYRADTSVDNGAAYCELIGLKYN